MKILFLSIMLSLPAFAQIYSAPTSTQPQNLVCPECPACPAGPACPPEKQSSATNRDDSFGTLMGGFQFLNTWVPSKVTGSYTQIFNRDFSLEFEFATSKHDVDIGGFDVGELKENRYALLLKYYLGRSFNISLGPYISDLSLTLDESVTDVAGNRINDKAEISLVGVTFGVSNRWQFNNGITFGIDWLRINQPTGTYKVSERIFKDVDEENQDEIKRTDSLFRTVPAFTFFGVNVGYTF